MFLLACLSHIYAKPTQNIQVIHPKIGTTATSQDEKITLTLIAKKQNYGGDAKNTRECYIFPKKCEYPY